MPSVVPAVVAVMPASDVGVAGAAPPSAAAPGGVDSGGGAAASGGAPLAAAPAGEGVEGEELGAMGAGGLRGVSDGVGPGASGEGMGLLFGPDSQLKRGGGGPSEAERMDDIAAPDDSAVDAEM